MSSENPAGSDLGDQLQLFEDSIEQRRRSVLFALAICAGFLATMAASAVVVSSQHLPTIVVLSICGGSSFVFAGFIYGGRFSGLFADEEMLWTIFDDA